MKKVVNIAIGGVSFVIEEDAYTELSLYLQAVRDHFKRDDEQGEIVDDIELNIAEKFMAKKQGTIIQSKDVTEIIAQMGTVEDFAELSSDKSPDLPENEKKTKKLYRDTDDKIIAGVASGIAAYFGIDPVFVRLGFVLACFLNGFGILAYLVLWLVMPAARTVSQKLEMQGDPVTLHQFEKILKEKMPTKKKEYSEIQQFLALPFSFLKAIFGGVATLISKIVPLLRLAVGGIILIGSIATIIGVSIGFTFLHFSISSTLFAFPLIESLTGFEYFLGLVCLYLVSVIPIMLGVIIGVVLIKHTIPYLGRLLIAGIALWCIALFGVGHIASQVAPEYKTYLKNTQTYTSNTYELEPFESLSVRTSDNVHIIPGDDYSIVISESVSAFRKLNYTVHNKTLVLEEEDRVCIGCVPNTRDITITVPTLTALSVVRGAHITTDHLVTPSLTVDLAHSADVALDIDAQRIDVDMYYYPHLSITGSVDELAIRGQYSSDIDTSDLDTVKTSIDLQSSSQAILGNTEQLNVTLTESSSVRYSGEPQITQDISESSSFKKQF